MLGKRLTLLRDTRFEPYVDDLRRRLRAVADSIHPANFESLLDGTMRQAFQGASESVGATEGTVWLYSKKDAALIPAYNTRPDAPIMLGDIRQPVSAGLISMVFANERSFVENDVWKDPQQDKTLDARLGLRTLAMIATPFYFLGGCRGVVSCVQLAKAGDPEVESSGFHESHVAIVHNVATVLGRLLEHRILEITLGLDGTP